MTEIVGSGVIPQSNKQTKKQRKQYDIIGLKLQAQNLVGLKPLDTSNTAYLHKAYVITVQKSSTMFQQGERYFD